MSDIAFTRGPWKWGAEEDCEEDILSAEDGTTLVMQALEYPSREDANLIAAAPDMYSALKRISAGLSDEESIRALIKGEEVKAARMALAKAEGKA